jgi:hypothetical protein
MSHPAVQARGVEKRSRRRVRDAGVPGTFRSLLRPRWEEVPALSGIDLTLGEGESLALMVLASRAMFRAGLRRYESGNLLTGRQ